MKLLKRKANELSLPSLKKRKTSGRDQPTASRPKPKATRDAVEEANALDALEFQKRYIDEHHLRYSPTDETPGLTATFKSSANLGANELASCFSLIELSSRKDYEASKTFGWHPRLKKDEMKEDEMRYLLLRRDTSTSAMPVKQGAIEGFLSFMLTHDSEPSVPVLYVYEIHLAESLRGMGVGSKLMDAAESIADRVGAQKIMLTCFLSNTKAHGFYRSRGYERDICSPGDRTTRKKVTKIEYVIMSKSLTQPKSATVDE